jgi:hypothetical protein
VKSACTSALSQGPSVDAFPDVDGQAHLSSQVATPLKENAPNLLVEEPSIERFDIMAPSCPSSRRGADDDGGSLHVNCQRSVVMSRTAASMPSPVRSTGSM